jgi:hypothetical protein
VCIHSSLGTIQIPTQLKIGIGTLKDYFLHSESGLLSADNLSEIPFVYAFLSSAECSRRFILFASCVCS